MGRILGVTTKLDDAKRESLRKDYETQKLNNELVGILSVSPWKSDSEVENYKHELSKEFMTVNEKYFADFNNKDDMEFQAEEPIDGQALYAVIDNIVQEVLNNKDANIEELLKRERQTSRKIILTTQNNNKTDEGGKYGKK